MARVPLAAVEVGWFAVRLVSFRELSDGSVLSKRAVLLYVGDCFHS